MCYRFWPTTLAVSPRYPVALKRHRAPLAPLIRADGGCSVWIPNRQLTTLPRPGILTVGPFLLIGRAWGLTTLVGVRPRSIAAHGAIQLAILPGFGPRIRPTTMWFSSVTTSLAQVLEISWLVAKAPATSTGFSIPHLIALMRFPMVNSSYLRIHSVQLIPAVVSVISRSRSRSMERTMFRS